LALVTGGARRVGRAVALELARQGYAIALHYHQSIQQAEQTAEEIRGLGASVTLFRADLSDAEQVRALFAGVASLPNTLRILVNSAAVMLRADLLTISPEEWDTTLALNLRAPLLAAQSAAPLMHSGGLIINITDVGARRAWTGFPAYTVSKAGLEALTRLLARALAPKIRVNAIAPGLILPSGQLSEADWQRLVNRVPLQRAGSPEEIAQTVAFLLHNEYITGQTLVVDGGYQMV
ncbi:MAG: SDR family oxidoreductase, partial [Anaerolineaceae bacterium]|nr:SDR family oxidoreductase [Anaerolineaceae bacterium]